MNDIEKHANGNGGMTSAGNTLTNVPGGVGNNGRAGGFPLGADPGGSYPYTLGASALQQQLYQGGLPLRRFANPAPL